MEFNGFPPLPFIAYIILIIIFSFFTTFIIIIIEFNIKYSNLIHPNNKWFIKLKNLFAHIHFESIFNLVRFWFELLTWLAITGAITYIADKNKDDIILHFLMHTTYFVIFMYLSTKMLEMIYKHILINPAFQDSFPEEILPVMRSIAYAPPAKQEELGEKLVLDPYRIRKWGIKLFMKTFMIALLVLIFLIFLWQISLVELYELLQKIALKMT